MGAFDDVAIGAANWWAERIGAPTHDIGDDGMAGFMTMALGAMLADQHEPTAEQSASFVQVLAAKIAAEMQRQAEQWPDHEQRLVLGCDYGPDRLLAEAAKEAGVSVQRFPYKTNSYVYVDHVVGSIGYRGPNRIVWRREGVVLPPCAAREWIEVPEGFVKGTLYAYRPWACSLERNHDGEHNYSTPAPGCSVCGEVESDYAHREEHASTHHAFTPGPLVACRRCGTLEDRVRRFLAAGREDLAGCRRWVEARHTGKYRTVREEGPVSSYGIVHWGPAKYEEIVEPGHWESNGEHEFVPVPETAPEVAR